MFLTHSSNPHLPTNLPLLFFYGFLIVLCDIVQWFEYFSVGYSQQFYSKSLMKYFAKSVAYIQGQIKCLPQNSRKINIYFFYWWIFESLVLDHKEHTFAHFLLHSLFLSISLDHLNLNCNLFVVCVFLCSSLCQNLHPCTIYITFVNRFLSTYKKTLSNSRW